MNLRAATFPSPTLNAIMQFKPKTIAQHFLCPDVAFPTASLSEKKCLRFAWLEKFSALPLLEKSKEAVVCVGMHVEKRDR